jgi:hypothetical protein
MMPERVLHRNNATRYSLVDTKGLELTLFNR